MYARTTTVQGAPHAVDDGIALVRDQVWPELRQRPACIGLSMLADRDSGRCIITTAWSTDEPTHPASDSVSSLPDQAADVLGGTPEVSCWEIARVHRFRPSGDGACAEVTWCAARPEQLDRDLDVYTYSMVPELEDVPGFSSVSQLVDRATGRSATAISYLSRTALTRAHRQVEAMRQEFAHMTGVEVLEVADFDLVVAHLRVPEMA